MIARLVSAAAVLRACVCGWRACVHVVLFLDFSAMQKELAVALTVDCLDLYVMCLSRWVRWLTRLMFCLFAV